jgi:pilus assembly protein FimV
MPNLVSTILSSLVFALVPMVSQAIGLGNIMLHSHLNEPLDADIAIIDTKGIEPSDVIVTVADQKAYEEAGLQPIGWLTSIDFQIVKSEMGGRPVLKLKTKQAVKDPFVDLLIDVKWPGGQLQREFTLLLDPPKSVIPASRPIQKKQKISPVIGAPSAKIFKGECDPTIEQGMSRHVETTPGGIYGPICEESLWSIAKSLAHNTHSNVHQAVMAIAEKNPHAFRDGNINYMLSGAVLKLPDKSELESYSIDQSQYYIAMQGKTPYHEPRFTHPKPMAEVQKKTTIAQKSPTVKPERALKLVAPVQSLEPAVKVTADAPKTQNQVVLADRLTLIEEAIDTLKRTNEDMTRKNQSLQDQNHSLEKLLSMKEDEIKKLVDMVKQPQPNASLTATSTVPPIPTPTVASTPVEQFAVAISDVPAKPTHPDLAQPNISQMLAGKPITTTHPAPSNIPNVGTSSQPVVPNLAESEMKPNTIKVDNIAPHSQPQSKAISADETGTSTQEKAETNSDEKSGSSLLLFILLGFGVIALCVAWLRRHHIGDYFETLKERLSMFHVKQEFAPANAIEPLEMANYGLQFDLDKALDAIAAQEKKFKKPSQSGVKLIKDVDSANQFDAKFADAEECISYERFGQAEKILKEILQQKPDEWLAVYKLLDLYVLTEKYADFIKLHEGLPADLQDISPRIWSKIETLRQTVTNEAVRFKSTKEPLAKSKPIAQEEKEVVDLKKEYPLALEQDGTEDSINIEALPTVEVEELSKDTTSNTHDIQKAQIALAKAYIDMGEYNDAKEILNELKKEAFGEQLKQIEELLHSIS